MQVTTGTVVNGKIILEGVALTEGSLVAVVSRGADETFSLSSEQEAELAAALEQVDEGHFLSLDQVLASLPKKN